MTTPATPVHWATRPNGAERSDRPSETSRLVAYLHLTVQLISGDRQQFVQTDPDAAANILDQIRPERLFAQRHFILAGRGAATVIPTESVERVEVRTDPLPEWPYHPADIAGIDEIAEEEFLRVQRREPAPPVRVLVLGRIVPSSGTDMAILVRTRSGAANYLSVRRRRAPGAAPDVEAVAEVVAEAASWAVPTARRAVTAVTAEDAHHFLSHLFARPVLFGRTEGGDGLFLLNPANAVSFTLAPPPPGSVAGAWPMRSAAP